MLKASNTIWFRTVGVWFLFAGIFFMIHASINGFWSNFDPYYHAKHSALMAETGDWTLVRPWLSHHFFSYAPTDLWWGFHVMQGFFIKLFGIVWGTKLLMSMLAGAIYAGLYYFLKSLHVAKPLVWSIVLFLSSQYFAYRLLLERPFVLGIFLFMLAWWFALKNKHLLLAMLGAVFVLFYELGPVLLVMLCAVSVARYAHTRTFSLRPYGALGAGLLLGYALHPEALHYMYVSYVVLWRVLWLKFSGVDLRVGAEIQQDPFSEFLVSHAPLLIMFILTLAAYPVVLRALKSAEQKIVLTSLGLLSTFWFLATLLIPRFSDFWTPFSWLFAAASITYFSKTDEWQMARIFVKRMLGDTRLLRSFVVVVVSVLFLSRMAFLFTDIIAHNNDEFTLRFRQVNDWLLENTKQGDLVFYNNWSWWPIMFFYNDTNKYVTGMDPTLLYEYDSATYRAWRSIGEHGTVCFVDQWCAKVSSRAQLRQTVPVLRDVFGASYLLMEKTNNIPPYSVFTAQPQAYEFVFESGPLVLFEIK